MNTTITITTGRIEEIEIRNIVSEITITIEINHTEAEISITTGLETEREIEIMTDP